MEMMRSCRWELREAGLMSVVQERRCIVSERWEAQPDRGDAETNKPGRDDTTPRRNVVGWMVGHGGCVA